MFSVTEQIVLRKPKQVVNYFLPYENLKVGNLLRITAKDARGKREGQFLIKVLATTMETKIGFSPIVRFLQSDFALYGRDKATPVVLSNSSYIANVSLSALHIPQFIPMNKLCEGMYCERDLSFQNFHGGPGHAYVAGISMIEMFDPDPWEDPLEAERWVEIFLGKIKARELNERLRLERRDEILRGRIEIRSFSGMFSFSPEQKNGSRLLTDSNGRFVVVKLLRLRHNKVEYELRSGNDAGKVIERQCVSVKPDPSLEF